MRIQRKARCFTVGKRRGRGGSERPSGGGRRRGKPDGNSGKPGNPGGRKESGRDSGRGVSKRSQEWRASGSGSEDRPGNQKPKGKTSGASGGDHIYGIRPVVEALISTRREVREVLDASDNEEITRLAKSRNIRVKRTTRDDLDDLTGGGVHQGVAAKVGGYPYSSLDEILANPAPLVLVLEGVTDPHNLGAALRVADGVGASGVVIPKDRASGITPVAVKASAGASEHVRVAQVTNVRRALDEMKKHGVWTFCAEALEDDAPDDIVPYTQMDFTGGVAVVLGSEGSGVRRLVREGCDGAVGIPMMGGVSSLNVSVAAAVLLYEVRRQRGA